MGWTPSGRNLRRASGQEGHPKGPCGPSAFADGVSPMNSRQTAIGARCKTAMDSLMVTLGDLDQAK